MTNIVQQTWASVQTSNLPALSTLIDTQLQNLRNAFSSINPREKNNPLLLVMLASMKDNDEISLLQKLHEAFGPTVLRQNTTALLQQFNFRGRTPDAKFKTKKFQYIVEQYISGAGIKDQKFATNVIILLMLQCNLDLVKKCLQNPSIKSAIENTSPENQSWLRSTAGNQDSNQKCKDKGFEDAVTSLTGSTEHKPEPTNTGARTDSTASTKAALEAVEQAVFDKDLLQSSPKEHCELAIKAVTHTRSQCASQKSLCAEEIGKMLKKALVQIEDQDCNLTPDTVAESPCLTVGTITSAVNTTFNTLSVHPTTTNDSGCTKLVTSSCEEIDPTFCVNSLMHVGGALTIFYNELNHIS